MIEIEILLTFVYFARESENYLPVEMDEDEEGAYIFMLQKWVRT